MKADIPYETEAFERRLRARGRSPSTVTTYRKAIDQLAAYLIAHGQSLADAEVTRQTLEEFLVDARTRMSDTTLSQRFRSLQQFWKFVATENEAESPMAGMSPPTVSLRPPEVLTPDELKRLFAACSGTAFEDRRDLTILSLFADTGIRRGEMAGIKTTEMDLGEQVVVVTGKTGTRGVPYGSQTATRLDGYLRARRRHPDAGLPWLWLGRKGRFTQYGIEGIVESRGKKAGLDLNPHLFRHTFAHLWLDGGGNEGDLQRLAGWSSGQMLQRYGASAASARARRAYLAGRSPVDKLGT
jgi:site-specific recombinase XerD